MEYKDLLAMTTLAGLSEEEQLEIVGSVFDSSFDHNSLEGIDHGFTLAETIQQETLKPENLTILFYDLSNGYSYLRKLKYTERLESWSFQMEELRNEIFYLRKAIASPGFEKISQDRQCQIYTNLANSFSFIGRFVEANEYWNKAIKIKPNFAMAIGNLANGLFYYGKALFDNVHTNLFIVTAYHHFVHALQYKSRLHIDARTGFQQIHDVLKNHISNNFPKEYLMDFPKLDDYDLGTDQALREYRLWCLSNTLFINPLNDLGPFSTACHDCLHLPTLTLPANRPPVCLNLYNQIKQEFATARYAYYESTRANKPHISDHDVPLIDTMEAVKYSYYIEQLKISFRLAYSILDKIAYLLNDYLELAIAPNQVSFRGLWYIKQEKMQLRPFFENSENWALRGLYWLSKDLYEKDRNFDQVLEPEAKEVAAIRNYIEHKGFKIVSDFAPAFDFFDQPDISYTISREEFERKTMKLLKLTRAAVIYLSIAIAQEESKKDFSGVPSFKVQPNTIPDYLRY
jgi:tetratricopeptide (TPR) repeat protein